MGGAPHLRKLRERNRGGPRFSFFDGPVTANKTLGVHTAWGRALKDVFQRYQALNGCDERYQNGFDCQGLWIEVGVEHALGLNSKREIEEYGLEAFARECREVVVSSAEQLTRGSKRLGQWMDWGNDYFTFSDTNIEYIWKFLQIVNEKGWLYLGHRSTEWCPRCGTSLSQHELTQAGVYQERADPLAVRALPAPRAAGRVARRVDDDAVDAARQRRCGCQAGCRVRAAGQRPVGRGRALSDETFEEVLRGKRDGGVGLRGAVRHARPARRSTTASSRGTRSPSRRNRHRPHCAGSGTGGLRARARSTACRSWPPSTRRALLSRIRLAPRGSRLWRPPTRSSVT